MRFTMRAYGRPVGDAAPCGAATVELRASVLPAASDEARALWSRLSGKRHWRGYSVFDARGVLVEYYQPLVGAEAPTIR